MSVAQFSVLVGAAYGFLGVLLGAFGAHGLKTRLTPEMLAIWKTGVDYHLVHAVMLVLVGMIALQKPSTAITNSAICFGLGILLFSGSLYALALSGVRVLGAVTPIGGLLFLAGWMLLFWAGLKRW
jgi:uncharacterized membrane protein YgdD (TMEM256/DUF423 family)